MQIVWQFRTYINYFQTKMYNVNESEMLKLAIYIEDI